MPRVTEERSFLPYVPIIDAGAIENCRSTVAEKSDWRHNETSGSNHKKPLLRMWLESGSLRPLHTRLGSGLINVLLVWLGAVSRTGCPVANVVITVRLRPLAATSAHIGMFPLKCRPRPNGRSHTRFPTARCRTSNVAGPFEQLRQSEIWL